MATQAVSLGGFYKAGLQKAAENADYAKQLLTLARTLWAEDRNGGARGMAAVANVVMNRVKLGFAATVVGVCLAPSQFSPWNKGSAAIPQMMQQTLSSTNPQFRLALSLAEAALQGKLPDITHGATHFHAPYVNPDWADISRKTQEIGGHIFYNLGQIGNELGKLGNQFMNFVRPSTADIVTSRFGAPRDGGARRHAGLDIGAHAGEPVFAAMDGVVTRIERNTSAGDIVTLFHGTDKNGKRLETRYIHVDAPKTLKLGQSLSAGQAFARVGLKDDASTGAHLHFEIRVNGKAINPETFWTKAPEPDGPQFQLASFPGSIFENKFYAGDFQLLTFDAIKAEFNGHPGIMKMLGDAKKAGWRFKLDPSETVTEPRIVGAHAKHNDTDTAYIVIPRSWDAKKAATYLKTQLEVFEKFGGARDAYYIAKSASEKLKDLSALIPATRAALPGNKTLLASTGSPTVPAETRALHVSVVVSKDSKVTQGEISPDGKHVVLPNGLNEKWTEFSFVTNNALANYRQMQIKEKASPGTYPDLPGTEKEYVLQTLKNYGDNTLAKKAFFENAAKIWEKNYDNRFVLAPQKPVNLMAPTPKTEPSPYLKVNNDSLLRADLVNYKSGPSTSAAKAREHGSAVSFKPKTAKPVYPKGKPAPHARPLQRQQPTGRKFNLNEGMVQAEPAAPATAAAASIAQTSPSVFALNA